MIAGFLLFFMQAGLALVETGFTRAKNVANIMDLGIEQELTLLKEEKLKIDLHL